MPYKNPPQAAHHSFMPRRDHTDHLLLVLCHGARTTTPIARTCFVGMLYLARTQAAATERGESRRGADASPDLGLNSGVR